MEPTIPVEPLEASTPPQGIESSTSGLCQHPLLDSVPLVPRHDGYILKLLCDILWPYFFKTGKLADDLTKLPKNLSPGKESANPSLTFLP